MKTILLSITLAFVTAQVVAAGELGAAAAPLKISEWVKGQPVDLVAVKGKQVVVVEFWATWCPPCRTSIPHLTEMQKKFKDVIFVGVTDEESGVVKKFVSKMGQQMDYRVAIDDARQTSDGYMKAFGVNGIPNAFVVDKAGRVVWQGHPMGGLEQAVEQVLAGTFDVEKAKKRELARQKLQAFYEAAGSGADEAKLDAMGKELEALDTELGGLLPGEKFDPAEARKMVKFRKLLQEYQAAMESPGAGADLAKLENQLQEYAPKNFKLADIKESFVLRKVFQKYYYAATGRRDADKLSEYGKELAALKISNAEALNQIAWTILTDQNIRTRDLALAVKLAKAGVTASDGKEAAILDTYARALFDSGNAAEAIAQQQKAIAVAGDEATKKELESTLEKYRAKTSARTAPGD